MPISIIVKAKKTSEAIYGRKLKCVSCYSPNLILIKMTRFVMKAVTDMANKNSNTKSFI